MICFHGVLIGIILSFVFPCFSSAVQEQYPDCRICHKYLTVKTIVHPPALASCVSCHTEPHRKGQKHAKGLSEEGAKLCFGCHNKADFEDYSGKFVHPAVKAPDPMTACTGCHNPHSSDNPKLLEEAVPALCFRCHNDKKFSGKTVHVPAGRGMCTACHFPHRSQNKHLLKADGAHLCFRCHSDKAFSGTVKHFAAADGQCFFCHSAHASADILLLNGPVNEVCAKCHKRVHVKGSARGHPVAGKKDPQRLGREFSCTSCHAAHSADSPQLFRYKVNSEQEICGYCHKDRR